MGRRVLERGWSNHRDCMDRRLIPQNTQAGLEAERSCGTRPGHEPSRDWRCSGISHQVCAGLCPSERADDFTWAWSGTQGFLGRKRAWWRRAAALQGQQPSFLKPDGCLERGPRGVRSQIVESPAAPTNTAPQACILSLLQPRRVPPRNVTGKMLPVDRSLLMDVPAPENCFGFEETTCGCAERSYRSQPRGISDSGKSRSSPAYSLSRLLTPVQFFR